MENGLEWNGNFAMDYGRCQNGMEDFKNEMEDSLSYFHTNFILDFVHIVFTEKCIPMSGGHKQYCHKSIQLQSLRVIFVDKLRYFGCLYCVRIASL